MLMAARRCVKKLAISERCRWLYQGCVGSAMSLAAGRVLMRAQKLVILRKGSKFSSRALQELEEPY